MRLFLILFLTFLSIPVFSQEYKPGYYFDYLGKKHEGLLRHVSSPGGRNRTDNYIQFKANEQSKKEKFDIDDMYSFVIAKDSFCIATNFSIRGSNSFYIRDFVKVLESGKLNLYEHYTTASRQSAPIAGLGTVSASITMTSDIKTLLLSKDEKTVKIKNNKELKEIFPELINEYPELLEVKKRTSNEEVIEIIKAFNSKFSKVDLVSKKAKIILYRIKTGESSELMKILVNDDMKVSLSRLDQTKLEFDDLTSVTICSNSDTTQCLTVTAIWHQDTYINCSMNKKNKIHILEEDYEAAAYYVFRAEQNTNRKKR